jgi:hypothetical protein
MDKDRASILVGLPLYTSPGAYSLLIGSGVSRSAGILTGFEIRQDLIRKLMGLSDSRSKASPDAWYRRRYREPPSYGNVIKRCAVYPGVRPDLLESYFEGRTPREAHHAIARLVKQGYVKVIITTNFDRLIEQALDAAGAEYQVLSTRDDFRGAKPYGIVQCTLAKIHGDFRDPLYRLRNTKEELEQYPREIASFLNRVLSDLGLVICGWSSRWDVALRDALLGRRCQRYPTYWATRRRLVAGEEDGRFGNQLQPIRVLIRDADQFFSDLEKSVIVLSSFDREYPVSEEELAFRSLRALLSDQNSRIERHDLLRETASRVFQTLASPRFDPALEPTLVEQFRARLAEYEGATALLVRMAACIAYFAQPPEPDQIAKILSMLMEKPFRTGSATFTKLLLYPALLVSYASGIAALASRNYPELRGVFLDYPNAAPVRSQGVRLLHAGVVFSREAEIWVPSPNAMSYASAGIPPASEHLCDVLRVHMTEYFPTARNYEEVFDLFEYLQGLMVHSGRTDIAADDQDRLYGRFVRRFVSGPFPSGSFYWADDPFTYGPEWRELLTSGLFDGSINSLTEANFRYRAHLRRLVSASSASV